MNHLSILKKVLPILLGLTFFLLSLGGMVRAMNAGLACPDWPFCFGKVIPEFDTQIFYEWFHRKTAALVGVITLFVAYLTLKSSVSRVSKITVFVALGILVVQIILGGLTVLKLLDFGIVTAHLVCGILFFGTLLWLKFQISNPPDVGSSPMPLFFLGVLFLVIAVVFIQIILGGLVSSNYAGLMCPDFPLCNGEWIPTLKGVLGLQVIHRLGAYLVIVTAISLYQLVLWNKDKSWMTRSIQKLSRMLISVVLVQVAIGIANVKFGIPPIVTVIHLAMAVTIFGTVLRLIYIGVYSHFSMRL